MKGIPLDPGNAEPIRIAVRIPAGIKAAFDQFCVERGVTMSDMIRELISDEMRRHTTMSEIHRPAE